MRFLIVTLCLLASLPLYAVEHSGSVRAADQFIPGATVTARQGGAKLVTYTDENGRYSLDLTPGEWEIEISMFGFKTLTTPVTIKDTVTSRDWVLEVPRPGEVMAPAKPAAAEAKKPDAAPTPAPASAAKPAASSTPTAAATPTAAPATAAGGGGQGRRAGQNGQAQTAAGQAGRGARGARGNQQQTPAPAFQNADVTATDAGAQALAMAENEPAPDIASGDTSDSYMVNGSTSGGLGAASDEQAARMQMMGRSGRGGPGGAGMGGPGGATFDVRIRP